MLVLARKSKEIIRIGDNITVKVISIRNGQVKLGIEAPREVKVHRGDDVRGEKVQKESVHKESAGPATSSTDGGVKPEPAEK